MKIFKRIAVTVLSGVVLTSSLSSCNLFKKLSMGEMISEMNEIKNCNIKVVADVEDGEDNINFSFAGKCNNYNMSYDDLSLKVDPKEKDDYSQQPIDLNCKDLMKYVDKNIYVNIQSIVDFVMKASSGNLIQINVDELGFKWIKIPMDFDFENNIEESKEFNNTVINSFVDVLKSSDTKIEEDGDNGYKVTVSDNAQFAKIAGETAKKLKADKDTYISQYKSIMESIDYKKFFDKAMDVAMDAVKSLCDQLGIKYTDEDLKQIKEKASSSIPFEDLNITDENLKEIENSYDDFVAELEDMQKKITDSKDEVKVTYAVSLKGKDGSRVGTHTITIDGKDENGEKITGKINIEINENDESIKAPKDSNTIGKCIENVIDFAVKNGYISEDDLKQFEGMNLLDVMDMMNQEPEVESDFDFNDYEDLDYDNLPLDDFGSTDIVA